MNLLSTQCVRLVANSYQFISARRPKLKLAVYNFNMFFVGLTGGIASGKSTVTNMFIEFGLPVIDADAVARKVVEPGRTAWKKLKKEFGDEIFNQDSTLNREKMAQIIFSDSQKRKKLNLITHPEIVKQMLLSALKLGFQGHPYIVLDIPLLFETGELIRFMHKIIVINCSEDIQVKRLMARNNLTKEEAITRISCQMPLEEKCQRADFVIDNSATLEETKEQVVKVINELNRIKFHYKIRCIILSGLGVLIFALIYLFRS